MFTFCLFRAYQNNKFKKCFLFALYQAFGLQCDCLHLKKVINERLFPAGELQSYSSKTFKHMLKSVYIQQIL